MQPTDFIDRNFILVVVFTLGLIMATLVYLGALHFMLRGKLWFIPLIILFGLFGYTMFEMDQDFRQASMGTVDDLIFLVILKTAVILHGVYYLSVLLGKYIGLKKAVISLKESEVFIVLMSIVAIVVMNNVHTFRWNFDRGLIMNIINIVMVYIIVNVVFYLGEIKYFFIYAVPVFLVFMHNKQVGTAYADEKILAFYQMQVFLIISLLLSALYFGIKIRLEFMEDREISRLIQDVKMHKAKDKIKD